jgi:hypothetical protein
VFTASCISDVFSFDYLLLFAFLKESFNIIIFCVIDSIPLSLLSILSTDSENYF